MREIRLSDEEWGTMREFLRQESRTHLGQDEDGCRRIFSRFDKRDRAYLGVVQFVCALVWLR